MLTPSDYEAILNLPLERNDSDQDTVRAYLGAQLAELWKWDEGFSGKRPFGNSGWKHDLVYPLVLAGFLEGKQLDETYYDVDEGELVAVILGAISHLCGNTPRA